MKKNIKILIPYILFFFLVVIFFIRLFYPTLSVFVTPDFGQSDLLNGYYPVRYLLFQSLKNNQLGLWTRLEGNGYPMFADGQIGSLFLPNLILFKFLPFFWAINISYIFTFFTAGVGTYLLTKEFVKDKLLSLLSTVILTFSGFMIMQISHISIIQSASLLPLELFFVQKILSKKTLKNVFFLALFISQQIFAGHQEITFYSILSIIIFVLTKFFVEIKKKTFFHLSKYFFPIFISILIGTILSSALLLPSLELLQISGGNSETFYFFYPFKHFITFLFPFFYGSPKYATYKSFQDGLTIFWENTGYVGIIPMIALFLSFCFLKQKNIKILLSILACSLVLILGKTTPLFFLFEIFPFSFFRVPARFLMLADLSLAVLAATTISLLFKKIKSAKLKKIFYCLLILFQVGNIFYYFYFYHPTAYAKDWFANPQSVLMLKKDPTDFRVFTMFDTKKWNDIFLKEGWIHPQKYKEFTEGLVLHGNDFFDIAKSNLDFKFIPKRQAIFKELAESNFYYLDDKIISTASAKLLGLQNTKYIFTPSEITVANLPLILKTKIYSIYINPYFQNRIRFVTNYKLFSDLDDIKDYIKSGEFNAENEILLEKPVSIKPRTCDSCLNSIKLIKNEDRELIIKTSANSDQLLLLADSYYPGWKAYIDNKEAEIYPANIVQRVIEVPKGNHNIQFLYNPKSFLYGLYISLTGYVFIILFYTFNFFVNIKNK